MQTNRLKLDINYHALNQAFVFLQFEWQESNGQKSQWANSYHLDDILAEYRAEACLFQYGRFAYVMLKRDGIDDIDTIISTLRNKADYDAIRIQVVQATPEIKAPCITGKWLIQILFNALANFDSQYLAFHNLNGRFYYFPSGEMKKKSITAFETVIKEQNNQNVVTVKAVTCQQSASVQFDDKKSGKTKHNALKKPLYRLESGTLRRVFDKNDSQKTDYVFSGKSGTKATSKALDIASVAKFQRSRMGILHHILARFNQRFSGIAQANWHQYEVTHSHTERFRLLKYPPKTIAQRMQSMTLRLIDRIDTADSQALCNDMLIELEKLNVTATLGKNLGKDIFHLCLIQSKASYQEKGEKDRYINNPAHIIQHLTDEGYKNADAKDKLLQNLIKEMWIKQDIVNGEFLLAKDAMPSLTGNWVFGRIFGKKEAESCHCIQITPDGKLSHFEHEKGVICQSHHYANEITTFLKFYHRKDNNYLRANIECFVITPDKSVNVIIRTDEVILPKLDVIEEELKQVDRQLTQAQTPQQIANHLRNHDGMDDCEIFIERLAQFDGHFDKKALNTLLKDCHKKQSKEYKAIRQALMAMGIHLSFSKSTTNLHNKMGDLFDIHAGIHNEQSAWYAVGYYNNALKHSLEHQVHLREVRCLAGINQYESILPWLDVDFVGFNRQTVIPFPMKYLREMMCYCK